MGKFGNVSFTVGVRRFFYAVTPNESSFENLEDVPDYLNEAVPYFAGAILLEFVICWLKGISTFRLNDGLSSIMAGLFLQLSKFLFISFELVAYSWIHTNYRLVDLPWNSPWTWFIAFLAVDFLYYWFHRASHEVNFIWASHQVHHSAEDYNLTTALRQSVVQRYFRGFVNIPSALFVPPSAYFVHVQFNLLYQFWIHTELIKSLGPLEYILNTPSHHRVHHGRNPYCIDKNYGGTLIIFDRLFGTFQGETEEKVVYGLITPVNTWNPVWIQVCHYVHIAKTMWKMEGFMNKVYILIKGPGWLPGAPRLGKPEDIPQIENPIVKYNKGLSLSGNFYIVIHTILFILIFDELTRQKLNLSQANATSVVLYLFATGVCFGLLMDNKWYASHIELIRCVFTVAFLFVHHQSLPQNRIKVSQPLLEGTQMIYAASATIWLLVFLTSHKIVEKQN